MTPELTKGDVVRFVTANERFGTRFVVRAVDGGQAWLTVLNGGHTVREQVVWIDGLVRDDL